MEWVGKSAMGVLSKVMITTGAVTLVSAVLIYRFFNSECAESEKGGASFEEVYAKLLAEKGGVEASALPEAANKREISQPSGPVRPLLIIYGTEYGASREIAYKLEKMIRESSALKDLYWPRVVDLEDYNVLEFDKEHLVLSICSTYGDGVPPTSARAFFDAIEASPLDLKHINYTVLALGDKGYPHFCRAGKTLDARFTQFGGKTIVPRHEVDQEDWSVIDKWLESVLKALEAPELSESIPLRDEDYLYEKQARGEFGSSVVRVSRRTPYLAKIIGKRLITKVEKTDDKETFHIEFELEEDCGVQYVCGDALAIIPFNCEKEVDEFLSLWKVSATQSVPTPPWNYLPLNGSEQEKEVRATLPLREALLRCYDLKNIKPELFTLLQRHAPAGSEEARKLEELLSTGGTSKDNIALKDYIHGREVVDVLEAFPQSVAALESVEQLLGELKQLLPRYYSISSAQRADPRKVTVTAAVVRYDTHGRQRKGVTTTYLADRVEVGQRVSVFVNANPDFRLPSESSRPIIMIGPGTGIAPFRAFLQERILDSQDRSAADLGANVLFFGCRHSDRDYLYREELEALVEKGHLSLFTAFSRDQADRKVYVQHRLLEAGAFVWKLLEEQSAHLYICGDAQYMAPDVHKALLEIITTQGGKSQEEAEHYLETLEKTNRYQKDVWFE